MEVVFSQKNTFENSILYLYRTWRLCFPKKIHLKIRSDIYTVHGGCVFPKNTFENSILDLNRTRCVFPKNTLENSIYIHTVRRGVFSQKKYI